MREGYSSRRVCLSVCAEIERSLPWMAIHLVGHFPADNTHAHCAYASSPNFAMDAPCRKLSLRSSFMMMESSN